MNPLPAPTRSFHTALLHQLLLVLAAAFVCPAVSAQSCDSVTAIAGSARDTRPAPGAGDSMQKIVDRQVVPLPDRLTLPLRSERLRLGYELDVSACAATPATSLWLFRVSAPYRITAGGQPLTLLNPRSLLSPLLGMGSSGALDEMHNGRVPALFAIPPGTRLVRVEFQTLPYMPTGIVRAELGPAAMLLPVQADAAELAIAYVDTASVVLLVISAAALILWLSRRGDRSLLWLAVACGLWGLRGLLFFGHRVYLHPMTFEQFNSLNVLLTSSALSVSIFHLLGGMRRYEMHAMRGALVLGSAGFAMAAALSQGAAAARALSLFLPFCMVTWLLLRVWRARAAGMRWRNATLVAGLAFLLSCGAHDLLLLGGVLTPVSPSYLFWGFVVLLLIMAAMSGQYVVRTLNRAERSNEELEMHVERKTEELERSYARLRDSERDAAGAQERERLLRDMHDGLGAQLMTALRGVERGALAPAQVAQSLQDSLDELRLLMDSADMGHYLPGALAAWRNRWDGRLAAAGITLDWRIDESLDHVNLSSEVALQVMRILQEAAANVVKHAKARSMRLTAGVCDDGKGGRMLCIEIEDDGVGIGTDTERPGARGLKNMQYRARQIGAELAIAAREAPQQGCRVVLRLPMA